MGSIHTDAWLDGIFSTAAGKPYDRDWISANNVDADVSKGASEQVHSRSSGQTRCCRRRRQAMCDIPLAWNASGHRGRVAISFSASSVRIAPA